jgi:CBS domain-containing protein
MSLRLFLRLLVSSLLGFLLVVAIGAALQLREIATLAEDVVGPDARLLEAVGEMQRILGEQDRGRDFEAAFREQLYRVEAAETTADERAAATAVSEAFDAWLVSRDPEEAAAAEARTRDAVTVLGTIASDQATRTTEAIRSEATTAAIGLGILGACVVVVGVWISRVVQRTLLDRLAAIDRAVGEIERGDLRRRVGSTGSDELARIGAALDRVLDLRDRGEAAVEGRNRELRAMLVALLHTHARPAAVTGIDGEIIVSTLTADEADVLRSMTGQLRSAARTLLSRHFVSAAELATDVRTDEHVVHLQALALGEQRVVGWLALFDRQDGSGRSPRPVVAGVGPS